MRGFVVLPILVFLMSHALIMAPFLKESETLEREVKTIALESRVQALAKGIMSTHGRMRHMTTEKALNIARHAVATVAMPQHRWLPVEVLLGVAANESDYRPWLICEGGKKTPKGWDCGMLQTRVTIFHGRTRKSRRLCKRLTQDLGLAMRYSARELTHYKRTYCKRFRPGISKMWSTNMKRVIRISKFWRCILNAYNQGPRYFREELCGSDKCKRHARYWIRVLCFAKGVETAKKIRWRYKCRKALSLRWIKKAYRL